MSAAALKSLDTVVDVEQRLRDLYREVGLDPELLQDDSKGAAHQQIR